ncbi:Sua5/YciO/YrdC/YwlC family protein [Candidatus Erwinia haradaeae]|uniref:Threonylcarbamoyl-AMP synthase n=1 Tax=Candidatus Erwinia haradaeae TaxID=1922217 RepID=A0A451DPM2_9GAMM|nr:Sua5/YciO/YrdC/YwlC family protein [Candidatus Erwinia haradaeae]VFP88737.1 Threonylcarbamoyl-AMP synthase [Candidatus Erwinia haradaeae]
MNLSTHSLLQCAHYIGNAMVIAYPTESMFGLGCHPSYKLAIMHLLSLKKRSIKKGFILVAANYQQLIPWVADEKLSLQQKKLMFSTWPGPVTWILPARNITPYWLTGEFTTIAVRVSNHPSIIDLCLACNTALVSTSANITTHPPCRYLTELFEQFGHNFPVLSGEIGWQTHPSEMRSIFTGERIR